MPGEHELKVFTLGTIEDVPKNVYFVQAVLLVVGSLLYLWRKGLLEGLRCTMFLLLAEWVFLIFGICLLFRESATERCFNFVPFSSYFDYGENSYFLERAALNVLNVALFIPVGFLLGPGFKGINWKNVLLIGLGLSFLIELLQFIFIRGLCETDDLIHNVLGCAIGFGIYCIFAWIWGKVVRLKPNQNDNSLYSSQVKEND